VSGNASGSGIWSERSAETLTVPLSSASRSGSVMNGKARSWQLLRMEEWERQERSGWFKAVPFVLYDAPNQPLCNILAL